MDLVPYMYFEKQEPGSQLCAQHCLNNILQQYTYSEFDLADIAQKLDQAENAALDNAHQNKRSYNLDDTGFFSISVLERALEVWDLSLVRWRGEAMKPFQEHPEDQAAFILNLSSHWLPLRRFAPNPPHASATKRWYNLNSFLPAPEWISPTYLRLVLTQAEQEGYSVFVVRRATPGTAQGTDAGEGQGWEDGGIGHLPDCMADDMAVDLGEPVGRQGSAASGGVGGITKGGGSGGFGGSAGPSHPTSMSVDPDAPTVDPSDSLPSGGPSSPPARRRRRQEDLTPSDPIEAELDEFSRPAVTRTRQSSSRSTPAPAADRDIFDNQSFPLHDDDENAYGGDRIENLDDDDDDEEIFSSGAGEEDPFQSAGTGRGAANRRGTGLGMGGEADMFGGPTDFQFHSRSYDDEDEALQAALKASMMDVPADYVHPSLPPKQEDNSAILFPKMEPPVDSRAGAGAAASGTRKSLESREAMAVDESEEDKEEQGTEQEEDEDRPAEAVSPDEIRRRRLARFGQ